MTVKVYGAVPKEFEFQRPIWPSILTIFFMFYVALSLVFITIQSAKIEVLQDRLNQVESEQAEINYMFGTEPFMSRDEYHERRGQE